MKLDGRRESNNVEDRRTQGASMGKIGSIGLGGIIIAGLMAWLTGGDPLQAVLGAAQEQMSGQVIEQGEGGREFTQEEQELAQFSKQILAGTEDVWTEIFAENNLKYECPKMVLYTGATQTGCGYGQAAMGPFYCSGDQTVYIDLSFFSSMKKQFGSAGDFAYAYVIAHEVGHHVQYLLGTLTQAHNKMNQVSKTEANQISVRLELQADYYAGVWAHHDNKHFQSLEAGDVEEGLEIASRIGDDYLQKKAQGYEVPESFNHGRSEWRVRWLKNGIQKGDAGYGNKIFELPYGQF